jgi:spermidine synthase
MNQMATYLEEDPDLKVTYLWHNTRCLYRQTTHRGTLLEIIDRPIWGLSCYMDGVIQSCERDQDLYHEALVKAAFQYFVRNTNHIKVCILGGGEGATAKKVLERDRVSQVDMIEWDRDVLDLFQDRFSMWANWDDERLSIYNDDVYAVYRDRRSYHIVIADLFDFKIEDVEEWTLLLRKVGRWTKNCLTLYIGTHAPFIRSSDPILRKVRKALREMGFATHLSSIYIPSFHGFAIFLTGVR